MGDVCILVFVSNISLSQGKIWTQNLSGMINHIFDINIQLCISIHFCKDFFIVPLLICFTVYSMCVCEKMSPLLCEFWTTWNVWCLFAGFLYRYIFFFHCVAAAWQFSSICCIFVPLLKVFCVCETGLVWCFT